MFLPTFLLIYSSFKSTLSHPSLYFYFILGLQHPLTLLNNSLTKPLWGEKVSIPKLQPQQPQQPHSQQQPQPQLQQQQPHTPVKKKEKGFFFYMFSLTHLNTT